MGSHGCVAVTTRVLKSQQMLALGLAVLLFSLSRVRAQVESELQSPAQALQDLLDRHGDNGSITVPQLRSLLALLSQRQTQGDGESSTLLGKPSTPPKSNSSKVRT